MPGRSILNSPRLLQALLWGGIFSFTVWAGAPATMTIAAGNSQTALAGTAVPGIICVLVSDAGGQPVPGVTVTWGTVTGGGSITGPKQVTLGNGIATLGSWTLGPAINTITADSAGINSVTFTANGVVPQNGINAVMQWDNALLHAIAVAKVGPTISARVMCMVHCGIYDAWSAYDPLAVGTRLGGTLRRPVAEFTDANKTTALSFAAYRVLMDLFPIQRPAFDAQMKALNLDPAQTTTDTTTPEGIGNTVAAAIITYRHNDGSNQLGSLNPGAYTDYTSYSPMNTSSVIEDPNHWQPLLISGVEQQFLTPFWGLDMTFAIGPSDEKMRSGLAPRVKPAVFGSKSYRKQSDDVLALSAGLTDETKTIATYWADPGGTFTPPGHWCMFAQFVSQRDQHTLDDDVKMFFALSNALFDVSVEVWDLKRKYDSVRPVTSIRYLYKGKPIQAWGGPGLGTATISGENFQSYITTPAFAEYISGHSTFSAAGAEILASFTRSSKFGMSVTLQPGSSQIEPGTVPAQAVTLSWKTFSDAANQAGISRRYGGIHYKDGDLQGRMLGKKIGVIGWKKAKAYFAGKVPAPN